VRHPYFKFLSSKNYCNSSKNKTNIQILNNLPTRRNNPHDWGNLTRTQTEGLIYNDKKQYDKIFYYEDYKKICYFISNNFGTTLIEENKNVTKKYNKNLTTEEKRLIQKIYKKDFNNFYPELIPKLHIIHRIDKINTGDMVSNCSEYYSFDDYTIIKHDIYSPVFASIKKNDPIILSGGGLLNCLESWNKNINKLLELSKNVFGWGIGFNKHHNTHIKTKINLSKFKLLGIRDYKQSYHIKVIQDIFHVLLVIYHN